MINLTLFGSDHVAHGHIAIDRDGEPPKAVVRNGRIYYYATTLTIDDIRVYIEGDQPYTITEF